MNDIRIELQLIHVNKNNSILYGSCYILMRRLFSILIIDFTTTAYGTRFCVDTNQD